MSKKLSPDQLAKIKYTNLNNHTYFSLLKGYGSIEDNQKVHAEKGLYGLAVTDLSTMQGLLEFYRNVGEKSLSDYGYKWEDFPKVMGTDVYLVDTKFIKDKRNYPRRVTIFIKDAKGFENLSYLISLSTRTENSCDTVREKRVPRVDWNDLVQHKEGLIITSGVFEGFVAQPIAFKKYELKKFIQENISDKTFIKTLSKKSFKPKDDEDKDRVESIKKIREDIYLKDCLVKLVQEEYEEYLNIFCQENSFPVSEMNAEKMTGILSVSSDREKFEKIVEDELSSLFSIIQEHNPKEIIENFKEEFEDDFYLELNFLDRSVYWDDEINDHEFLSTNPQVDVNDYLIKIGKELNIKCILTQESMIPKKEDHIQQSIMLYNADWNKKKDWHYYNEQFIHSVEEMYDIIQKEYKDIDDKTFIEICENSQLIVEKCRNVELLFKPSLPTLDYDEHYVNKVPVVIKRSLVLELQEVGVWSEPLKDKIKDLQSLSSFKEIPQELKEKYPTKESIIDFDDMENRKKENKELEETLLKMEDHYKDDKDLIKLLTRSREDIQLRTSLKVIMRNKKLLPKHIDHEKLLEHWFDEIIENVNFERKYWKLFYTDVQYKMLQNSNFVFDDYVLEKYLEDFRHLPESHQNFFKQIENKNYSLSEHFEKLFIADLNLSKEGFDKYLSNVFELDQFKDAKEKFEKMTDHEYEQFLFLLKKCFFVSIRDIPQDRKIKLIERESEKFLKWQKEIINFISDDLSKKSINEKLNDLFISRNKKFLDILFTCFKNNLFEEESWEEFWKFTEKYKEDEKFIGFLNNNLEKHEIGLLANKYNLITIEDDPMLLLGDKEYRDRLIFEIMTIQYNGKLKLITYFMLIEDVCNFHKENNYIYGLGRGSGAGSLFAHGLDVTNCDPLYYGLYFERFLTKERIGALYIEHPEYKKEDFLGEVKGDLYESILKLIKKDRDVDELEIWKKEELWYLWCNEEDMVYLLNLHKSLKGKKVDNKLNSTILYLIGITDEKPKAIISQDPTTLPDIDYDTMAKDAVNKYLIYKYDDKFVTLMGTFGFLKTKGVIKDIMKQARPELNFDYVNKFTKLFDAIDEVSYGKSYLAYFNDCLNEVPQLKQWFERNPDVHEYVLTMMGSLKNLGKHAGGVVVAGDEVAKRVPCRQDADSGIYTTEPNMDHVEWAGLIKYDFLGLKTLFDILRAWLLIEKRHGIRLNWDNINFYDPIIFERFRNGDAMTVFQFNKSWQRKYIQNLNEIRSIEDLATITSILRPGPMEMGMHDEFIHYVNETKPIEYLHPSLKDMLKETYGITCIAKGSQVLTQEGQKNIEKVEIGDLVKTEDGSYQKVLNTLDQGLKKTLKIKCSNGEILQCTHDHKVLTQDGWKEAQDLSNKDLIKSFWVNEHKEDNNINHLKDWLIGFTIADGHLRNSSPTLACGKKEIAEKVRDLCQEVFPNMNNISVEHHTRCWYVVMKQKVGPNGSFSKDFEENEFINLMKELNLWGKKSTEKRLPKKYSLSMLAGLIDGDGSVDNFTINLKNKELAYDIYQAFQSYKIPSNFDYNEVTEVAKVSFNDLDNIIPYEIKEDKQKYKLNYIPLSYVSSYFKDLYKNVKDNSLKNIFNNKNQFISRKSCNYYVKKHNLNIVEFEKNIDHDHWSRVLSVKEDKIKRVYDLTIENVHSFVVGGLVVHNCYQEQVMAIVSEIGDIRGNDSVTVLKAMGKKKLKALMKYKTKFIQVAQEKFPNEMSKVVDHYVTNFSNKFIEFNLDSNLEPIGDANKRINEDVRLDLSVVQDLAKNHKKKGLIENIPNLEDDKLKHYEFYHLTYELIEDAKKTYHFHIRENEKGYHIVFNKVEVILCEKIWLFLEAFAKYGFNKSHAVAYSTISYVCMWLKHYYPIEWVTACMSGAKGNNDDFKEYYQEWHDSILNPDLNRSKNDYFIVDEEENGKIVEKSLSPFYTINGVGAKAVSFIVETQPYSSLSDFYARVNKSKVNKKAFIHLILSGSMDSLKPTLTITIKKEISQAFVEKYIVDNKIKKKSFKEDDYKKYKTAILKGLISKPFKKHLESLDYFYDLEIVGKHDMLILNVRTKKESKDEFKVKDLAKECSTVLKSLKIGLTGEDVSIEVLNKYQFRCQSVLNYFRLRYEEKRVDKKTFERDQEIMKFVLNSKSPSYLLKEISILNLTYFDYYTFFSKAMKQFEALSPKGVIDQAKKNIKNFDPESSGYKKPQGFKTWVGGAIRSAKIEKVFDETRDDFGMEYARVVLSNKGKTLRIKIPIAVLSRNDETASGIMRIRDWVFEAEDNPIPMLMKIVVGYWRKDDNDSWKPYYGLDPDTLQNMKVLLDLSKSKLEDDDE